MGKLTASLDNRWYAEYSANWDDRLFREEILSVLRPEDRILDIGAGAGIVEAMNLQGLAKQVCGIDPDPRVLDNPLLDEAKVGTGEQIDYPDEHFDLVVADNVLEHLENPEETFLEIARVLKPGGHFLFKTPNRYHYMPLVAMSTPTWVHKKINRARGREADDTFPTRYRANSKSQILELSKSSGFSVTRLQLIEGRPEYLRFSVPTYFAGWIYEKLVNSSSMLASFRILLIGQLKKD